MAEGIRPVRHELPHGVPGLALRSLRRLGELVDLDQRHGRGGAAAVALRYTG
jgi:hypothetical protein